MFNKIHDIVFNNPKVKVRAIAEIISILTERMVNILYTDLCVRKLDQKPIRVTISKKNLAYFNRNPGGSASIYDDG